MMEVISGYTNAGKRAAAAGEKAPAVVVSNLVKLYGHKNETVRALKGISFNVSRGELFGIVGPDGAGKTSLFRILATLLLPDGGSATMDGFDVVKDFNSIRQRVGYMPGRFSLYQDLSVEENLHFFATIFNTSITENYAMIKDIYAQIEPFKKRRAGKLSGGMKQKLALCCALVHRPSVLLLDEPTTGVDAVSRKEFWEMLRQLKAQGITILVSTPYMDEAGLCDRVALIQEGRLLSIDTPRQIVEQFNRQLVAVKADNMLTLLQSARAFEGSQDGYPFGEYHHVVLKPGYNIGQLAAYLQEASHKNLVVIPATANIEDCFMAFMKEK
jgi:ABC-type multidrug transport system ATPase subunit